jgi:hypothetical protein
MRAIILAAGYSTCLRSLTDNTAKPLLRIDSTTILDFILESFQNKEFGKDPGCSKCQVLLPSGLAKSLFVI